MRAFNLAWPPLAYSIRDDDEARRTYALIVTYYLLLSFTIVLALSLEARWVVRALAAPAVLRLLQGGAAGVHRRRRCTRCIWCWSSSRSGGPGARSTTSRSPRWPRAVNLGLNLLLVPPYGIVGAGIALVVSYLVMLALMFAVTRRLFPVAVRVGPDRAHRRLSRSASSRGGAAAARPRARRVRAAGGTRPGFWLRCT